MRKDRKALYTLSVSLLAVLLLALFIPYGGSSRIIAALLLLTAAVVTKFFLKKRAIPNIEHRQVLLLMGVIAVLYVTLYFLTGFRFGFYRNALFITNPQVLFRYVLPITVAVIATEYMRVAFMAQNSKFATAAFFLCSLSAEVLITTNISQIRNFYNVMDLVGLTLLPTVTANVLYCYVARRFGLAPSLLYRLIISLFPYVFPIGVLIPDSLYAFAKLLIPLAIYAFLLLLFEKRQSAAVRKTSKWSYVGIGAIILCLTGMIMVVSCQFRIGALVIATESMTGEINKGDVTIYERYDGQQIDEGQVIVFKKGNVRIVHRVVDIRHVNGVTRYYTKGDANPETDIGYITDSDIIGLATLKIPYLGYPSLWVRDAFAK